MQCGLRHYASPSLFSTYSMCVPIPVQTFVHRLIISHASLLRAPHCQVNAIVARNTALVEEQARAAAAAQLQVRILMNSSDIFTVGFFGEYDRYFLPDISRQIFSPSDIFHLVWYRHMAQLSCSSFVFSKSCFFLFRTCVIESCHRSRPKRCVTRSRRWSGPSSSSSAP